MKKIKIFGLASTLILAGAAGFTSCSSDSAEPIGGGTGVAGQVVKTQFAINIPYGGNGSSSNLSHKSTRMTDAITQQSGKPFRGISNIVLLTFNGDPTTANITNATSIINIGTDGNAYAKDEYCRLYRDIEIPVGTSYIAFYGRATKENGVSEFKTGKITDNSDKTTEKTLTNISHKLTPISSTADFTSDAEAVKIIGALNNIAKANVKDNETTYTWATIGNATSLPTWLTVQEQDFLKKRYDAFIKLKAGSKNSVEAFIKSLKSALVGESGNTTVPDEKMLTKAIVNQCDAALTEIGNLNFPGKFNLPDGVATLSWISGAFAYDTPETEPFNTGNSINYNKICYPAELSYFVNTKTMVSDKDMSNLSEFPSYTDWTTNTQAGWEAKTSFTENAVESSTKTVGLKAPVQYSVAVLQSTIKCAGTTLKDNGQSKGELKADQDVPVNTGFPVTGILIGGQPELVDWKYEPTSTETFVNTIYDQNMNGTITAGTTTSTPNYTLVFDNKSTDKKTVFVTIELKNNSDMDFYGQDGIILKDAKFYLVGKLDPDATEGVNNTGNVNRVFVQDHITKANFTIKNLKNAYNCIPDLRTSGINVGLAVDLEWKDGIEFNVDL